MKCYMTGHILIQVTACVGLTVYLGAFSNLLTISRPDEWYSRNVRTNLDVYVSITVTRSISLLVDY